MPNRIVQSLHLEYIQALLTDFGRQTPGVQAAIAMTADGFEVASYQAGKSVTAKLAAMGSSIQALASALSSEAGLVGLRSTLIEADTGIALIVAVPGARVPLTLAFVANRSAIVGHLLWSARNLVAEIESRKETA
ncbi:diacylglyceryl transferase [Ahniella affigens]|uniref:Diacylglyceryl transferase n=1 Tax=Ahniella affigens TaxID=2021234 RepID=A0A2P1PQL5_9GAMM|nr:roadblock/LC7 domain-containing protein [Ahniella affigens]AVP97119.1 diacylglyceryl transferase [Ahniella affigens]